MHRTGGEWLHQLQSLREEMFVSEDFSPPRSCCLPSEYCEDSVGLWWPGRVGGREGGREERKGGMKGEEGRRKGWREGGRGRGQGGRRR